MKKLLVFILFVIGLLSCNTTEPPEDKPGRRDYIWKVDSLKSDDWFGISDIWGDSPTNIWLTASGVTGWDCLWHYDGTNWERYSEYLNPALNTVFGITQDEVWIGDSYGGIWRNVGSGWQRFQEIKVNGYDWIIIGSIYGAVQNNLYAVGTASHYDGSGYKAIILRYDGKNWNLVNIPDINVGFEKIRRFANGKYIIMGTNYDSGFLEKLFVFDGTNLKEIYSDYAYPGLYEMSGEVYIVINHKIYKCRNDELILWKEFPGTSYYGSVLGRSEKDFLGAGYDGILHYNGSDLANLYSTEQIELGGWLIFEKDVFFAGYTSEQRYIIIRGTLKE